MTFIIQSFINYMHYCCIGVVIFKLFDLTDCKIYYLSVINLAIIWLVWLILVHIRTKKRPYQVSDELFLQ